MEISLDDIEADIRPLVVYFDDIRACFEASSLAIRGGKIVPAWELSFNAKTTATIALDWPLAFRLLADIGPHAIEPCDTRTWEFVDLNVSDVMAAHPGPQWTELANALTHRLLRPLDAARGPGRPRAPPAVRRQRRA